MITFAPMALLARPSRGRTLARPRVTVAAFLALLSCAPFGRALAQSGVGPLDDATPIPGGWIRFGVLNSWTRYDSRFNGEGRIDPLGAPLSRTPWDPASARCSRRWKA